VAAFVIFFKMLEFVQLTGPFICGTFANDLNFLSGLIWFFNIPPAIKETI